MSEKNAARQPTAPKPSRESARDTLPSVDQELLRDQEQEFLRDQIEALLASPAVTQTRRAFRGREPENETEAAEIDSAAFDPNTEPSADAGRIRDALSAAGKSA